MTGPGTATPDAPAAGALDGPAGTRAMAWRVLVPFGGTLLWAVHLVVAYGGVEVICRRSGGDDAGTAIDVFVLVVTVVAAVPAALLVLVARRLRRAEEEAAEPDDLRPFAARFSAWLNAVMLVAIVAEGALAMAVRPC